MSKINKIKLSGTTYDIQDLSATSVVNVTQAQYEALVTGGTVDPTILYNITDAQAGDLSQYWTSAQTNSAITQAVSGKQDTLSAGTNITIVDNVISATGGGGGGKTVSGGTNISITTGETADTINCTVPASASSGGYSIMFGQPSSSGDASGSKSMTGGQWSKAYGEGSVAIGQMNESRGQWAWAIGNGTSAAGKAAFACGEHNSTNNPAEFTCGYATITSGGSDTSLMTLFTVGNGKDQGGYQRHNALDIRMNGDIYISDTNSTSVSNYWEKPMIKLQDALGGGGSITIDPSLDSGSTNAVANSAITTAINTVSGAIPSTYVSAMSIDTVPSWMRFVRFSTPSNFNYFLLDNPKINGTPIHKFTGVESQINQFSLVETSAITTSISSSSTDAQVPSAKAVYDTIGNINTILESI